jgi:hypothetical protein
MKLSIRVRTASGTRTIVTAGHDQDFAYAVKQALEHLAAQAMDPAALVAEVTEDGASIPMKEYMRRGKIAMARAAKTAEKAKKVEVVQLDNVESLANARKKKAAK